MQLPPVFQIGDRVRLISLLDMIPIGTVGTVVGQFIGNSLYDVQFDGQPRTRVVDASSLAPMPPELPQRQ
jgi:hypothetical protein